MYLHCAVFTASTTLPMACSQLHHGIRLVAYVCSYRRTSQLVMTQFGPVMAKVGVRLALHMLYVGLSC